MFDKSKGLWSFSLLTVKRGPGFNAREITGIIIWKFKVSSCFATRKEQVS